MDNIGSEAVIIIVVTLAVQWAIIRSAVVSALKSADKWRRLDNPAPKVDP